MNGKQALRPVVMLLENNDDEAFLFQLAARRTQACFDIEHVRTCAMARKFMAGAIHDQPATGVKAGVIDKRLDGESGIEFIRWARHQPWLRELTLIMYSGSGEENCLADCYAAGANYFVLKATHFSRLRAIVQCLSGCVESGDYSALMTLREYRGNPGTGPSHAPRSRAEPR